MQRAVFSFCAYWLCLPLPAARRDSPWWTPPGNRTGPAVQELLRGGADPNSRQGDGATALHWAAYWNDAAAVRLLLDSGASADTANDLGVSPLWLAAHNGNAGVVEALLGGRRGS